MSDNRANLHAGILVAELRIGLGVDEDALIIFTNLAVTNRLVGLCRRTGVGGQRIVVSMRRVSILGNGDIGPGALQPLPIGLAASNRVIVVRSAMENANGARLDDAVLTIDGSAVGIETT